MPFDFTPINIIMSAEESQKLSETDKMLLGEVDITPASGSTDNNMGEPSDSDNDKLNGTMGTSTLGDKKGNKIKSEEIKASQTALLPTYLLSHCTAHASYCCTTMSLLYSQCLVLLLDQ